MIKSTCINFLFFLILLLYKNNYTIARENIQKVYIKIENKKCNSQKLIIKNGKIQFFIKNNSHRKIEWKILQGIMIINERKNIAPGFTQKLTTYLDTGEYNITCGLLTNPKRKLIVQNKKENFNINNSFNSKKFF